MHIGDRREITTNFIQMANVFVRLFCEINHTIFACTSPYHPPITNLLLEETLVSPWFTIQRSEFFHAFSMVFHGFFSMGFPWPNEVMSAMVGTLPDAFTNEFLSLTDHLPVSRIEEVYRIIQRTFRQPPKVQRISRWESWTEPTCFGNVWVWDIYIYIIITV